MEPNRLLYQDFPVEIRRFYGDVALVRDWHSRHEGLVGLVELALSNLASLSLSDYRSRCTGPNANVENLLERAGSRNLPLGRILELLRTCAQAVPDPLIPPPTTFPRAAMDGLDRFAAAVDAIELAVAGQRSGFQPADIDVSVHVQRGLEGAVDAVDWWAGWRRVVEYRNKLAHQVTSRWPTRGDGFWEVMTPLFHGAVVDLLTEPTAAEAVLAHPVVSLTLVAKTDAGSFSHAVCGEDRGIPFEEEIELGEPITERWRNSSWKASTASSYFLDSGPEGWSFRGLYWDLRNGLPPAMKHPVEPAQIEPATPAPDPRRATKLRGSGVGPGTCGEFAQGILPGGTPFHITCPVNKSATVLVEIRPAKELSVVGLSAHHRKLGLAIENAVRDFDLGSVEVSIRHWSDIDVGKGMGSSTADVLAGIRAMADAAGQDFDPVAEGRMAAKIESSDGSMYPGIAAVNHRTCELVRSWDWYPQFAIVMLVPDECVDTPLIPFAGQEELAEDYGTLLDRVDAAIASRSAAAFSRESTRSAVLNSRFLLNPYSSQLCERFGDYGALGINVGHTGTVCGLLFPNSEDGRIRASETCFEIRHRFPDLKEVKVVTTPYCGLP
jgi:L-threonine kinase